VVVPPADYQVATASVTFTDDSRTAPPQQAGGGAHRTLVTTFHYPVDPTAGPSHAFPLVVFAHGFATPPATYDQLTTAWAADGYVVASPAFPATSGPSVDEGDLPNQVVDMSFLIGQIIAAGAPNAAGPLRGAVDPSRIAVAGHSDGGETVAALGLESCCIDARVGAVVVLAGAELPAPAGGTYSGTRHAPLLVVQGDSDQVDEPAFDNQLFSDVTPQKWYLDLIGGSHLTPFVDLTGRWSVVPAVTLDFLDWKLKGRADSAARFAADGDQPGLSTLVGQG
jgi:dienelactone hydrolase